MSDMASGINLSLICSRIAQLEGVRPLHAGPSTLRTCSHDRLPADSCLSSASTTSVDMPSPEGSTPYAAEAADSAAKENTAPAAYASLVACPVPTRPAASREIYYSWTAAFSRFPQTLSSVCAPTPGAAQAAGAANARPDATATLVAPECPVECAVRTTRTMIGTQQATTELAPSAVSLAEPSSTIEPEPNCAVETSLSQTKGPTPGVQSAIEQLHPTGQPIKTTVFRPPFRSARIAVPMSAIAIARHGPNATARRPDGASPLASPRMPQR